MPQRLHLDFESFSLAELPDVGAYRYSFDPSTEILCAAMALDEGEPVIWHRQVSDKELDSLTPYFDALENPAVLIYAHNAMMEISMSKALMWKTWSIAPPDLSRFRCTLSLARRAAFPASLEKLSEALELTNKKDKRGKALINKFSKMQTSKRVSRKNPNGTPPFRILPEDEPQAFAEFMAYCKQDVRAEQEIAHKLKYFDEPIGNSNYTLHERINARGVAVNLDALRHAQRLIDEETEVVSEQFRALVGFEITQGAKILEWLHGLGCNLPDLKAETIEAFLDEQDCLTCNNVGYTGTDLDIECEGFLSCPSCGGTSANPELPVIALRMKQSVAYASIKKVQTMLDCAGPNDNRIRGMLNHHGATTGRSTNSLVQFQNMKRPTIKYSEEAYQAICEGISLEMLRILYGPPLEVISSCIRHFVQDV